MHARHPRLASIEVADEGYVPLLDDADLIERIADIRSCDAAGSPA
jgi:hypothetical protein